MEIWVYNQYTDERNVVAIDAASATIGRDDSNDVRLDSPFVSRNHGRIYHDQAGFFFECLGLNGATVAKKSVEYKASLKLSYGDEIRIGEFSLYLMEPTARRVGGAAPAVTAAKRVVGLEREIHSELLGKLNLRVTGRIASNDAQQAALIKRHLLSIIENRREKIDQEMADYLVGQFLWRMVSTELARRATGKLMYSYGFEDSDLLESKYEDAISRIIGDLASGLPVRLQPHTLAEDLAAAEQAWPEQAARYSKRITPELRDYIVRRTLSKEIEDVVLGYGPLQDLLEMPNVNEIMVVGPDKIYIEKDGIVQNTGRSFFSSEIVQSIIERIVTPVGRRIDRSTPLVDARLPDGSRVNAVIDPLSLTGPTLTIRKFARIPFTIDDLVECRTLSEPVASFLRGCVLGRKNIIISGGTASGKTTTLNVLSNFIPPAERIVTIEDSAELQLLQEHLVSMETRPANVEGRGEYSIRDLVRNALRMRPDRLIVGECRGPEALDMLQAMNTGHDGSLTTIHANNPEDMVMRLETMVLMAVEMPVRAIREQISAALDLVLQMVRLPGGERRVTHISEITGIDPETESVVIEDIYRGPDSGATPTERDLLRHTGYIPTFAQDLLSKGMLAIEVFT